MNLGKIRQAERLLEDVLLEESVIRFDSISKYVMGDGLFDVLVTEGPVTLEAVGQTLVLVTPYGSSTDPNAVTTGFIPNAAIIIGNNVSLFIKPGLPCQFPEDAVNLVGTNSYAAPGLYKGSVTINIKEADVITDTVTIEYYMDLRLVSQ